jgi:SAM-dependent methyltransferase
MKNSRFATKRTKSIVPRKIRRATRFVFDSLIREQFQKRRANLFMNLLRPENGMAILDLGGGSGHFLTRIKDKVQARFVVADIENRHANTIHKKHGFEFVMLEEDKLLPFGDKEFDIVFSNSVIEHVTLPKELCSQRMPQQVWRSKSWDRQKQFADEIHRIGKAYFVQTPHKEFPIETHVWLPFANWLSHNHMLALVQLTNRYWIRRCRRVDWNLIGYKEMQVLFPKATIYVERIFGIPKSLVAYHR